MTLARLLFVPLVATILVLPAWVGAASPPADASVDSSQKDAVVVRVVSVPRAKDGAPVDLYVAPTKITVPSAVLVLCLDDGQDPKTVLGDPGWRNFAEDHRLGLAALSVTKGHDLDVKNGKPPARGSEAALILQAVDREYGQDVPLVIYGWPQRVAIAGSLLAANPKRVRSWCLRAPNHILAAGPEAPPGIVVCYKENKPVYDALMGDFSRARNAGERLTWIVLLGDYPRASSLPPLDIFVRNYFAAVLSSKINFDQWQNIDTKQPVSVMDLNSHPAISSYLPHPALATAWAALHVPGGPVISQQAITEREVETFNSFQPKLHLYFRRPASISGGEGKIEGVLAYCTWERSRGDIIGRLQNQSFYLVRYADEHHLALLTWDTADAFSNSQSADERDHQQNFDDGMGFDKLANAWERGVHALCVETNVPEDSFLLYGLSRGAQWAHRLALRKPAHFLAVHIHVNSSYDWPTSAAKNILWLQTTGEREYGYNAARRFYARCREMGYPIMFKAGENLGHASSPQIDLLGARFFDYALRVKKQRDELIARQTRLVGDPTPPDLNALSGLGDAPYFADFINQEVYPASQREMIPVGQRVPLPDKAMAQAWGEIVDAPALTLVSNSGNAKSASPDPSPPKSALLPAADTHSPDTGLSVAQPAAPVEPAAQLVREHLFVNPVDEHECEMSIERAVVVYPLLGEADSVMNKAFVAEYHRLKDAKSPVLDDPTWPEKLAAIFGPLGRWHP